MKGAEVAGKGAPPPRDPLHVDATPPSVPPSPPDSAKAVAKAVGPAVV